MNTMNEQKANLHILIVDDDDPFRLVMKEVLSNEGFRVEACDSGEIALELLQKQKFDTIVLDYKMTGMTGLNVLQWMFEQKMDSPVIMLTAAGSEFVAVEAMKLGAYDYIRKEQIDINHLGIIINGVHERYLFRKEKERRERMEQERMKSLVAIETFHSTLASLSQLVNNSLSVASMNIDDYKARLNPFVTNEGQQLLEKTFAAMKQQQTAISSAVKSILQSANLLHGNFSDSRYTSNIQETINGNLKDVQEKLYTVPEQRRS